MENVTPEKATKFDIMSCNLPQGHFEYTSRDVILYALGIGITPDDEQGLRYLYEKGKNFQVFPLYGIIMGLAENIKLLQLPGLKIKMENILHMDQFIEQHRPLPPNGKVTIHLQVVDVLDRNIGSQYIFKIRGSDDQGPLFTSEGAAFIKGDGNFGGRSVTDKRIHKIMPKPSNPPDDMLEFEIPMNLPAIFRLSGDYNPLHIDPEFAKLAKLDRPIVHGNCMMGITAQLILKKYAGGDARRFKSMMVRFAKVVYPGDTLLVYIWKKGNCIQFEVQTRESNSPVMTGGFVNIQDKPLDD